MQRFFATDMPASQFLRNTLIASLIGLTAMLVPYVAMTPGFGSMLAQGGPGLSRFLRQVLTNGLPVVFAVNYVGFLLIASSKARSSSHRVRMMALGLDIPIRVAIFVLLHALIYVKSADWFGSFGGSRETALRAVAPTLARSAFFENLSGVYLYATLVCALPLHVDLLRADCARMKGNPVLRHIMALLFAVLWLALAVLILTLLAARITKWQQA